MKWIIFTVTALIVTSCTSVTGNARLRSWDIAFIKPGVNDMDTLWAYQENLMTDSLESRLFYRSCQPSVEPLRLSGRGRIVW